VRVGARTIGLQGTKLLLVLLLALAVYGTLGAGQGHGSERFKTAQDPHSELASSKPWGEMTWTRRDLPEKRRTYFLESVAYGNGTFVAVGTQGIFASPDGTSWVRQPSPKDRTLKGLAYGNGTFVAVGYDAVFTSP